MSTETRNLSNIDGANVGNPDENVFTATGVPAYANDAAYEADFPAVTGAIYFNTTDKALREHNGTGWQYDKLVTSVVSNASLTGSNQDFTPSITDQVTRFTNGSLASIRSIVPTNQKTIWIINDQASASITLVNEAAAATAANRIRTGNGQDFVLDIGQTVNLIYDDEVSRWRIAGVSSSTGNTIESFANDAAYLAVHPAPTEGDMYWNSTEKVLKQYNGTAFQYDKLSLSVDTNSTLTGANQDLVPVNDQVIRLTQGSLTSIRSIDPAKQRLVWLINDQASNGITLVNESAGATAANRIRTGNGLDYVLKNNQAVELIYDEDLTRWRVAAKGAQTGIEAFASDAAFAAAHNPPVAGDRYWNTTSLVVREYDGAAWQNNKVLFETENNTTLTGASADAVPDGKQIIKFSNASLTSIRSISPAIQSFFILINGTGAAISIKNEDTGATAANRIITGTGVDLSLANTASLLLAYDSNSTRWRVVGGSGSGGSSDPTFINYFTDPGFESTANGAQPSQVSLYNDGASATPVDGTGGVVTGVTFLATTSSPIRGTTSAVLTKDAANRQGTGVSFAFTISSPDKGFTAGVNWEMVTSANYVAGDIVFYIYDVTNSALITPRFVSLPKLDSYGKFFSDYGLTTGTSYRLLLHIATTSALAYTVTFDTMVNTTTRVAVPGGGPGEWRQFTPTLTGTGSNPTRGTAVEKAYWRQNGTNMDLMYEYNQTVAGAAGSGTYVWALPSGYTIDTSKVTANTNEVGNVYAYNGTTEYTGYVVVSSTTAVYLGLFTSISASSALGSANVSLANATARIYFRASVPISEWSGSGTNMGPGAQYQAMYNSGTWAADDSASFAFGDGGAAMAGALGANRTKRVRSNYPIQAGWMPIVLVSSDQRTWVAASNARVNGIPIINGTDSTGLTYAGVYAERVSGSTTDIDVFFGRYMSIANDDAPAVEWPSSNAYWKVVLVNPSSPVGFGLATQTASGLVNNQVSSTNLTASDLTSQSGCTIDTADVTVCKWVMTNNTVTLMFRFDLMSITAATPGFSFTLPSSVPRPLVQTFGPLISVYDNTGSVGTPCEISMGTTGIITVNKASGATFTGGANGSYMRGQMSWSVL